MSLNKELKKLNPKIKKPNEKNSKIDAWVKINKLKITSAGTFDGKTGKKIKLKSGFQVSTKRPEVTNAQAELAAKKTKELKKIGMTVGAWKEGGKVVAEPSYTVATKEQAMDLAKTFNQKAIYDNAAGKVIKNKDFVGRNRRWLNVDNKGRLITTTIIVKNVGKKPVKNGPKTRPDLKK